MNSPIDIDPLEHIAIIMDGNGRWAQRQGKPRTFGHQAGLKATRNTVQNCMELGVSSLTLYAFSSENWHRPEQEVGMLLDLFLRALESEIAELNKNGVRLRFIGDISAFSAKLQERIHESETITASNTALNLCVAVNYGGRWDIVQAAQRLAAQVASGQLLPEQIDESHFSAALVTAEIPDPDLMIRTSGELRLSNYLLWQMAYTEFYFTDVLWPDFDKAELQRALTWFNRRERRFGKASEQAVPC